MATQPDIHARLAGADPLEAWPDPIALEDELPAVQAFDPDLLPSMLQGWVIDIAERMNCPADLVAIPAMVAAGAAIGRKVGIRPQRHTTWLEVGNLWGCIVAPPGSLKSPAAAEALAPFRQLEAEAAAENEAALADFRAQESLYKLERDQAEKTAKQSLKDKGRDNALALLKAVAEPVAPPMKRYITNDGTAEKLGEICRDNPNGFLVYRDELLSMMDDLDKPDKSSAKGFFLSAWSGMEGYTFDRIMRGTVRIEAVNLSVCGTTQPQRLAGYIRDSLRGHDDGMVQRLQLLAWPDFTGPFREVDRHPNCEARGQAHECFRDLASLDAVEIGATWDADSGPRSVRFLRFADDAQDMFSQWRGGLEQRLASDDLPPHLKAHFAKYRGLVPRLALVCHLANNAFGPVSLQAIGQALRWAEYLESHARRAYASISVDNAEAARAIWRRLRKGDLPATFTARDIQRKGWSGLGDKARVAMGLAALLDADWLMATDLPTGGRPSTVYTANPKALTL